MYRQVADCVALDEERCATVEPFVGNRVKGIQFLSSPSCWRHCPTKNIPADLVSRGCLLHTLPAHDL
ncbi:hypothetical protein T4B_14409 [Trichinella pseudospiralis]|uniref:Uncharacterized protein n=1 Tax=Trichinella pseudospiralis TaxID=6337 RepID=A0A0V1IQW0_TRIPS|nr:hypothetical protein T4B_14409 [Trichinella pseudospiralis]